MGDDLLDREHLLQAFKSIGVEHVDETVAFVCFVLHQDIYSVAADWTNILSAGPGQDRLCDQWAASLCDKNNPGFFNPAGRGLPITLQHNFLWSASFLFSRTHHTLFINPWQQYFPSLIMWYQSLLISGYRGDRVGYNIIQRGQGRIYYYTVGTGYIIIQRGQVRIYYHTEGTG